MFEKELLQLGLSDKEIKVYLASLELGPSAVQEIAKKAELKRPTTYYAIEELIGRGLMTSFKREKKALFSAESPERLASLALAQKKQAAALEKELQRVVPGLNKLFNSRGEKPQIRFFEGKEGLLAIQNDFLKSKVKILENIYPRDEFLKVFSQKEREAYKAKRAKKKIKVRAIYTSSEGEIMPQKDDFAERKFVSRETFPFSADITIYGDKVAIGTYKGKLLGAIIESKEVAETMRLIFELAWRGASK